MLPRARLGHLIIAAALSSVALTHSPTAVGAEDLIEIRIDGSSTVFPISEIYAEEFLAVDRSVDIKIGVSGTGGGFKKFCRGETDISNASRPIKSGERKACEAAGIDFIEVPVALDAIAVVVHPDNDWVDALTVSELQSMWRPEAQRLVTSWKDVRADFPDRELVLFGPGVDSGTYDYFTAAVVGKEHSSRGDYTASENDNVLVTGVAGDENALGFFGLAYYMENRKRVKAVPIQQNDTTQAVMPSFETAASGAYTPLSRPVFIYVNAKSADKVAGFIDFLLDFETAQSIVSEVGYVPLTEDAYSRIRERFAQRAHGSAFAGTSKVGASMEEITGATN